MRRRFLKVLMGGVLTPIASLWTASMARAGFPLSCCLHCGSKNCRKVCRLVREDRKITAVCFGVKDEDFCLPNPSCKKCKQCETICSDCRNAGEVKSGPKKLVWSDWAPAACGKVYTKRRLMRKTVTRTVPGFKWVVEDLCPACESATPEVEVPPGATIPPPPAPR